MRKKEDHDQDVARNRTVMTLKSDEPRNLMLCEIRLFETAIQAASKGMGVKGMLAKDSYDVLLLAGVDVYDDGGRYGTAQFSVNPELGLPEPAGALALWSMISQGLLNNDFVPLEVREKFAAAVAAVEAYAANPPVGLE